MGENKYKTIDKLSFKVNIPILISIIVGTATVYNAFYGLQTQVALLSQKLDEHIKQPATIISQIGDIKQAVKDVSDDNKKQDNKIVDIDRRVYVLEYKK